MALNGSSGPGPGPGTALRVTSSDTAISLTTPRPDVQRSRNEYIEAPLKGGLKSAAASQGVSPSLHSSDHLSLVQPARDKKSSSSKSLSATSPAPLKRSQSTRRSLPITKQPGSLTAVVDQSAAGGAGVGASDCSIICPECGKCRCEACRTPKALPEKWLCGDKCLCSAGAVVDYLSCLCCVKAALYHCAWHEEEDAAAADRPCSCGPQHRTARWACLAPLSLVLPCLFCYWPLRACVKLVEKCHQQCHRHGCQCRDKVHSQVISAPATVKKLLDKN